MKKTIISLGALALSATLGISPVFAATVTTSANATVNNGAVSASVSAKASAQAQKIITRSNTAIDNRVTALNNLAIRIGDLKNVSPAEKSNISATVQTNISGLTDLKTKIDGEVDVPTLQSDEKTITGSFRIYALIIPQGYILASADRVTVVSGLISDVSAKLQTRLSDLQSQGKDVSADMTLLADLNTQVSAANTESVSAQSGVTGLTPDQGDAAKAKANHDALVAARAHVKTATTDLGKARTDANAIIKDLGSAKLKVNASTTTAAPIQ